MTSAEMKEIEQNVNPLKDNSKQPESAGTNVSGASSEDSKVPYELEPHVIKDLEGENDKTGSYLHKEPLASKRTGPVDRINDPNSSTEGSDTNSVDSSKRNPIELPTMTETDSLVESNASRLNTNSQENRSESDASQFTFSLPNGFIEPTPKYLSEYVGNVIKNVDNPTDFKNALNGLRRKAKAPVNLRKSMVPYYADMLVEKEMRKAVLENVMEGDEEKIRAALGKYYRSVLQTKAVSELPSDAKDIKDVEMYRIARKCLLKGTLSASDKTKLEDILWSPEKTYTMGKYSSLCLGLKLKGDSVKDAAATVMAYFSGSDQLKEDYGFLSWHTDRFMFPVYFYQSREYMISGRSEYSLFRESLPHELHDEFFYRDDVKEMLLELIRGHPSNMLEDVKKYKLPLYSKIEKAITSAGFPRDDPLFMAKFSLQLWRYAGDVAYKMIQKTPGRDVYYIEKIMKYCESLMVKHITLVQLEPKDPRITNLMEWRAYKDDTYNLGLIINLSQAVSKAGIDPTSVEEYVYQTIEMQDLKKNNGPFTLPRRYREMLDNREIFC